jgi:hypothetical protein
VTGGCTIWDRKPSESPLTQSSTGDGLLSSWNTLPSHISFISLADLLAAFLRGRRGSMLVCAFPGPRLRSSVSARGSLRLISNGLILGQCNGSLSSGSSSSSSSAACNAASRASWGRARRNHCQERLMMCPMHRIRRFSRSKSTSNFVFKRVASTPRRGRQ